ncbi:uncharacterized protein TRAVEDRAFT_72571 [Trametes versicolor FP-101664 SS1]|uniref:uncharacterized protein n=1 Tax=Trametes versicolor (strain FP-101664) TaxID=717944 RepID=UPI0004623AB3|nr:uncharacterized protein TRAVEDRAFT_72571 [Trametes versicolor FP-101664 SS1]EIW57483.1 hypothetical protein TRAVEDRAFT_72571 [Trametes versicolor FP-101664 SS1]
MKTTPNSAVAAQRPRILLRELRKRRHPRRSDSLPCLQLAPENRPYFVCGACQFPNVLCELCPWCLARCDAAAPVAVVVTVRRRLSSPTLLNDAQKAQLARIERHGARAATRKPTSSHACRSDESAPDDLRELGGCEGQPEPAAVDRVRRAHRNAVLYSAADVVATATADSSLQPFLDEITATHLENLELEQRPTTVVSRKPSPPLTPSARPSRPCTTTPRMSTRDVSATEYSEPRTPPSGPPSPLPHTPSLRRKRRMSVLRQRSSCSLRRRATTTGSTMSHRRSDTVPATPTSPRPKAHSVRFSSPPPGSDPDMIPLGHPQRPLYTAIRKNMSSPAPSVRGSLDATFDPTLLERGTRSLDIPRFNSLGRSYLSVAAYSRPVLFPPSASGFSVSGETELRMDLARSRSMEGVPSDFAFSEVKPDASRMKAKMKSFGKTLKSLLKGKI